MTNTEREFGILRKTANVLVVDVLMMEVVTNHSFTVIRGYVALMLHKQLVLHCLLTEIHLVTHSSFVLTGVRGYLVNYLNLCLSGVYKKTNLEDFKL